MSKNLLMIFTRNPELGKVKTRLAKSLGNEKALEIYKFLLNRTKEITQQVSSDKAVFYSVKIRDNDIWDASIFLKFQQEGDDLGERMQNAFQKAFSNGYNKVAIIGSDLFDLTPNHITKAFEELDRNDIVLGPAEDGGYYLLASKKVHPKIFSNKEWGTSSVRKETLNDLEKESVHLLPMLNDVDVVEDIQNHPAFQQFLNS
ncbi:TIGR04282 family arsenosugar biosynthesis glycosyltransferase [Tenacibaculum agarivorans]|uniref:TIGR04282 family arsenosugar biosynthesis glycosyltransferase n=1 Tax=Tenacibaculum agarivorans TaxID=1908389 RepID=UPI00094BA8B4|nr:TIGR04282 family arsenosugar biosynthesis glycosyltransferase [Tenacibaculum agarivorans]